MIKVISIPQFAPAKYQRTLTHFLCDLLNEGTSEKDVQEYAKLFSDAYAFINSLEYVKINHIEFSSFIEFCIEVRVFDDENDPKSTAWIDKNFSLYIEEGNVIITQGRTKHIAEMSKLIVALENIILASVDYPADKLPQEKEQFLIPNTI